MKKSLFSIAAVAIAMIAFAFTVPAKKPTATYDFRFTGSVTNALQIQDEQNFWVEFSGLTQCNQVNDKACEIHDVPEEYTELVSGVRKLKTTVNIATAAGSGSNKYVSSTAPTTDIVINKQ